MKDLFGQIPEQARDDHLADKALELIRAGVADELISREELEAFRDSLTYIEWEESK